VFEALANSQAQLKPDLQSSYGCVEFALVKSLVILASLHSASDFMRLVKKPSGWADAARFADYKRSDEGRASPGILDHGFLKGLRDFRDRTRHVKPHCARKLAVGYREIFNRQPVQVRPDIFIHFNPFLPV
jgi:hypothetical protein